MTEWSEGYIAEIDYTFGYYQELNPLRINLAFLQAGLAVPQVATACELGFGQGLSANIHAAGSAVEWLGTDFNPAQACFAKELAATCGSNAQFYDQSFSEFCLREDLPDFDYIGLHGIWSWISDENRAIIADFIRRKLKAGGVLYISYNTTPGWSALLPLRDLLTEHAELIGASGGGIVPRINGALEFADQLLAVNPAYGRSNPQIAERLKLMKDQNRNYIAHEYFNRDWKPMSFSRVADWLTPAKVKFACSAHFLDFFDNVNLTQQQQSLVNTLPDTYFRETVRDYIINQQFRRDYWIKGARRLKSLEQMEALRSQRVLLTAPRDEISLKQTGAVGEINLSEAVYNPILDQLADHQIKSLAQLEQAVKPAGINFQQLTQAVIVLAGIGKLTAVQEQNLIAQAKKKTDKLNKYIIQQAVYSGDLNYLASPVTGGGIQIGRFQQLFLMVSHQGKKQHREWAEFVWQILEAQGQKIIKDGKPLETREQHLAQIEEQAVNFSAKQLPILRSLQIV